MTTLKQQTVSGIKWTLAASIAQRIISFGTTIVLARILSPTDFGLFALAFVMIDGFGIFKSLGFDSALVRRKDDIDKACNTAFFLIPAMGMILFFILFIFAPIGAKFLNNPQVTNIIRALAIVFVISCFGKVSQTVLYRSMKFKYKSIAEVSAQATFALIALTLALNNYGVWSLVIAYIFKNLVQISIEWYFSRWKPKFTFDKALAWEMFHFGKFVLAGGIIYFLQTNLDNIIIGKFLGVAMLGYYALSMNISNLLNDYLLGKIGMIMYPAYSRIQDDKEDVKRVMLKALKFISIIVFPFSFCLFIFAPDLLLLIFGQKWLPATNILRILAFVGMFRSLGSAIWSIFMARGKSKVDFQVNLAQVGIFFLLVVPLAIKFKLIGAGFALLVSTIISFCIGLIRVKRIIQVEFMEMFHAIKPAFVCSLLMLLGIIVLKPLTLTQISNYNFFLSGMLAVLIYLSATYLVNKDILRDIKDALA